MSKDRVLKYCSQFEYYSREHVENAIENKFLIEQERYSELNGCPSNYGLDEFDGLCMTEDKEVKGNKAKEDQCERCWKEALGIK